MRPPRRSGPPPGALAAERRRVFHEGDGRHSARERAEAEFARLMAPVAMPPGPARPAPPPAAPPPPPAPPARPAPPADLVELAAGADPATARRVAPLVPPEALVLFRRLTAGENPMPKAWKRRTMRALTELGVVAPAGAALRLTPRGAAVLLVMLRGPDR